MGGFDYVWVVAALGLIFAVYKYGVSKKPRRNAMRAMEKVLKEVRPEFPKGQRTFATLRKKAPGFKDDEVKMLLHEIGAEPFDGGELWKLK